MSCAYASSRDGPPRPKNAAAGRGVMASKAAAAARAAERREMEAGAGDCVWMGVCVCGWREWTGAGGGAGGRRAEEDRKFGTRGGEGKLSA